MGMLELLKRKAATTAKISGFQFISVGFFFIKILKNSHFKNFFNFHIIVIRI